jgi:hypothetical protein
MRPREPGRSLDVVIADANQRAGASRDRLVVELLLHLHFQIALSLEIAAYSRHHDHCEMVLGGTVVERDEARRPLIVRPRSNLDPPPTCTCGLSALVVRIPLPASVTPPEDPRDAADA